MVKCRDIVEFLRSEISETEQDSWDNSGVQIAIDDRKVSSVLFALSLSSKVVKEAIEKEVDMVITHHPITIAPIRRIDISVFPDKFFYLLMKNDISVYSLHTNLDVSLYGPTAIIGELIGLKSISCLVDSGVPYGICGAVSPLTQIELLRKLNSTLPKDVVRVVNFKPEKKVGRVSICSGSGGSLVSLAAKKSELYITGDLKYHDAELAIELDLTVFDMGHFGTEKLFAVKLEQLLKQKFPEITFLFAESEKSPFEVV